MQHSPSRRQFLSHSTAATAAVFASYAITGAAEKTQSSAFTVRGKQFHGLTTRRDEIIVSVDREVRLYGPGGELRKSWTLPRPARALTVAPTGRVYLALKNEILQLDERTGKLESVCKLKEDALITALSFSGNDLYVSEGTQKSVSRVTAEGQLTPHSAWKGADFPVDYFRVEADARGSIFISNPARHRIERVDSAGKVTRIGRKSRDLAGFGGCCNPVSFVVRSDGSVVTAEQGIARIKLFDADGDFQRVIAGPEQFPLQSQADRKGLCLSRGFDLALLSETQVAVLDRTTGQVQSFTI